MPATFDFDETLLHEPCETALPGVRLRRMTAGDAADMAMGLSDFDVAKNLLAVPHPYRLEDAREFLGGPGLSRHMLCAAIEVDGRFAGCAAIDAMTGAPELGYWLAKPYWGRGIVSAATQALVDLAFSATEVPALVSGHFVDNDASASVLAKLGCKRTGMVETRSRARPEPVRLVTMALDRAAWRARQVAIETPRLTLRPPVLADAEALARATADKALALMTAAIPKPFTADDARAFVLRSARRARPASMIFSIRMREDGALAGGVGWSAAEDGSVELGYWISAAHRGQGLATEAARAAIEAAFELTAASAATARCRIANPASRGVLERCGFQAVGTGLVRAPGSPGSVAVDVFRLDREVFFSLKEWAQSALRPIASRPAPAGAPDHAKSVAS